MTATLTDETGTLARVVANGVTRFVPIDPTNRDYAALVAAGTQFEAYVAPAPTPDDVQREYWRRLCLVLGAHDLAHAGFIRADDHAELQALLGVASPTAEQTARITEIEARDAAVVALIDAYNAIPTAPVPADYAAAPRWP